MNKTPLVIAAAALAVSLPTMRAQNAAPSASPNAPASATDLSQYKTADDLWAHITELKKGPKVRPRSKEEFQQFISQFDAAAQAFATQYSKDPRHWGAKLLHANLAATMASMGMQGSQESTREMLESTAKDVVAAPDASASDKHDARNMLLEIEFVKQGATPAVEKDIDAFSHDFPGDRGVDMLKFAFAKKVQSSDPAKAQAIYGQLAKSQNAQIASEAASALKAGEVMKKPLDLKYTAVDGTEVNVSKMRGKVVLVDFWATWCGPCMQEVPNVVAAYQKYHDKGFEIVGVSLDQDKDAMLKITKEKGMVWPQYFDGKGWQNSVSTSFGIDSIPAMWLVNKKGMVVTTDARDNLEGGIEKLLGE